MKKNVEITDDTIRVIINDIKKHLCDVISRADGVEGFAKIIRNVYKGAKYVGGNDYQRLVSAVIVTSRFIGTEDIHFRSVHKIEQTYDRLLAYRDYSGNLTSINALYIEPDTDTTYLIDCINNDIIDMTFRYVYL